MNIKLSTKMFFAVLLTAFSLSFAQVYAQNGLKPHYVGEIHTSYGSTSKVYGYDTYLGRVMLGTVHGVAFGRYGDVGVGIDGVMLTHYYRGQGMRFLMNPYISVNPAWPVSDKLSVFLDCAIGASIPLVNLKGGTVELLTQVGPGIKYKKMNFSLGIQNLGNGDGSTTFFAKLGFYLSKQK
ncbi:MAG: hypothetical protein E7091_07235 [Bacteroidales bacterium]|nr:hypothetical protein [Bacteroidales bacterium]